jgi:hypothetical protein
VVVAGVVCECGDATWRSDPARPEQRLTMFGPPPAPTDEEVRLGLQTARWHVIVFLSVVATLRAGTRGTCKCACYVCV